MNCSCLYLIILCIYSFLLFGCTGKDQPNNQVLRYTHAAKIITLDPARAPDHYTLVLLNQIHEGLLKIGENNKIVPAIAESWTVSKDLKTYVFNLRKNAYFQNGKQITAEDVKWTFQRASNKKLNSLLGSRF